MTSWRISTEPERIKRHLAALVDALGTDAQHQTDFLLAVDEPEGYEAVLLEHRQYGGMLLHRKGSHVRTVADPLAPMPLRGRLLLEGFACVASEFRVRKLTIEDASEQLRSQLTEATSDKNIPIRISRSWYRLMWPVYDLTTFDEALRGSSWEDQRYARQRLVNRYGVTFIPAAEASKEALRDLVRRWKESRHARDTVYAKEYEVFIERGFPGCDIALAAVAGKEIVGLTAGWRIPKSNAHYLFLSIHDYRDPYLGLAIETRHFQATKAAGYAYLEFGGTDKNGLMHKRKFNPTRFYDTHHLTLHLKDERNRKAFPTKKPLRRSVALKS